MDDKRLLYDFIRQHILKGYSREQIFNQINRQFGGSLEIIPVHIIGEWYFYLDTGQYGKVPQKFHPILKILNREFQKAKTSLEHQKCLAGDGDRCRMVMLNERYLLDVKLSREAELYLYDSLYGRRRLDLGVKKLF